MLCVVEEAGASGVSVNPFGTGERVVEFSDRLGNPRGLTVEIVAAKEVSSLSDRAVAEIQTIVFVRGDAESVSLKQEVNSWIAAFEQRAEKTHPFKVFVYRSGVVDEEWARNQKLLVKHLQDASQTDAVLAELVRASVEEADWRSWHDCIVDVKQSISSRTRAAFYLRTDGSIRSIQAIIDALLIKHDGALMRHELAYVLGQMQNSYACDVLAKILDDETDDLLVRHESAEALGAIGDKRYLDILTKHSQHPRPEIAETCRIAIDLFHWRANEAQTNSGKEGKDKSHHFLSVDPAPPAPKKSVSELEADLLDTSQSLFNRYRAMFALRNINSDESALALTRGLHDSSALFRHEVAYVLGQMEREVTAAALKAVLSDEGEHRMVRHECAESLGAIGSEAVTEVLCRFREDSEDVVKQSCEVALDAMDYWADFANDKNQVV